MVRATKEDKILKWLCKYDSNLIMFHHRNPTSTINVKRAAHPFSTKDYFGKTQYILVHNGVIRNARKLREKHEKLGIKYYSVLEDKTFNDSEALLWDVALFLQGKQEKLEAEGMIAFICIELEGKALKKMYFARNTSPLNLYRDKGGVALSSEGPGESIERDVLYTWSYKLNRLTNRKVTIPTGWENVSVSSNKNKKVRYIPSREEDRYEEDMWDKYKTSETSNFNRVHTVPQLGNKIGGWLAKKGTSYTKNTPHENHDYNRDGDIVDYVHDPKTQMLIPKNARQESIEKALESYIPLDSQVERVTREYLIACGGYFEPAYWAVEADYSELLGEKETKENIRMRLLLEAVMESIETDPENEGEKSKCSSIHQQWQRKLFEEVKLV